MSRRELLAVIGAALALPGLAEANYEAANGLVRVMMQEADLEISAAEELIFAQWETLPKQNVAYMVLDLTRLAGWDHSEIDLESFERAARFCDKPI